MQAQMKVQCEHVQANGCYAQMDTHLESKDASKCVLILAGRAGDGSLGILVGVLVLVDVSDVSVV